MRFIILLTLVLPITSALATCNVFIPKKEFNHAGYMINFDFTEMLYHKNYQEVYTSEESDLLITLEGIEEEGRFHRAVGLIQMGPYQAKESVVCWTQLCSLTDFAKAFRKSYLKLSKIIPECR